MSERNRLRSECWRRAQPTFRTIRSTIAAAREWINTGEVELFLNPAPMPSFCPCSTSRD